MSRFEQQLRDYYAERLGGTYITRDFGFAAIRISDGVLYVDHIYVEPNTHFRHSFSLARDIFRYARDNGATIVVGCNDPKLETYHDIRKLHQFFGFEFSGQMDGHREMWARSV